LEEDSDADLENNGPVEPVSEPQAHTTAD
jgi:hypothetical protein